MKFSFKKLKQFFCGRMFNLYQHMKNNAEGKEQKEPETTGHDRFYQERSRTSFRKKKRRGACRRAQSAAELNPDSIAAANKRNAFRIRSVSTDKEESEEENSERAPLVAQKIDSLAKLLFNKSITGTGSGKSSPSDAPASPKVGERSMEGSAALAICTEYLSHSQRYELISQLCAIGARPNKHWFAIHDKSIKTDRLLTLMPLTSKCPIDQNDRSRSLILELFRALHHPYIYPVLDLELCNGHALAVVPFNARGSLKDLIYKSTWNEEYGRKYGATGTGLPAWQVARFGRQMLEGLLFLKEKGFPPFRHLHSGNVVVQNGVARICGLETTLIGALPRCPIALAASLDNVEALSLGHVLYEMCAGSEIDLSLLPDLLPNYPHVVEIIELIFGPRTPTLHELLLCELFRKIDLREMKGSCLPNFSQRLSRSCLSLLGEVARRQPGPGGSGTASPCSRTPLRRSGHASPVTPSTPPARRMIAICITHPADLLKTQMQLLLRNTSRGMSDVVGGIIKESGFRGFYKGLSAALLRQCIYTTGRLGIYNWLQDWYYETYEERPQYRTMILMGMCGGVVGSVFGNPAEVALIRMTADRTLPPEKRRNYKNVFNALGRIWKEEGLFSMWRGCSATIVRSAIVNGTQLSTYTQVREMLKPVIGDGPHLYVLAALMSPIATTLVVMPVDNIKTKVQNAKGKANPMKMFTSIIKNEGLLALWHGMIPMYLKMAPNNILLFLLFEQMQNMYKRIVCLD